MGYRSPEPESLVDAGFQYFLPRPENDPSIVSGEVLDAATGDVRVLQAALTLSPKPVIGAGLTIRYL